MLVLPFPPSPVHQHLYGWYKLYKLLKWVVYDIAIPTLDLGPSLQKRTKNSENQRSGNARNKQTYQCIESAETKHEHQYLLQQFLSLHNKLLQKHLLSSPETAFRRGIKRKKCNDSFSLSQINCYTQYGETSQHLPLTGEESI